MRVPTFTFAKLVRYKRRPVTVTIFVHLTVHSLPMIGVVSAHNVDRSDTRMMLSFTTTNKLIHSVSQTNKKKVFVWGHTS